MLEPDPPVSAQQAARLLIVDGHAYAYRAFFAIRRLTSPTGAPTNAIYGFVKMLDKMREVLRPTHGVVVWDGGLAAERIAALPTYKSQRPEMPADLAHQLEQIPGYLEAAGIASVCEEGVEADDWIAALARRADADGTHVIIASSDKDFMQLVSPRIGLFNPGDKTQSVWSDEQVRARTGVEPAQIVDWLSLVGDAVDNIPGVTGVGPKTATDLLRQFGSVSGIYGRLAEVKSDRLRENLKTAAEAVRRNQELVRLNDQLPGDFSLKRFAWRPLDLHRLIELFKSWGFETMRRQMEEARTSQPALL